MASVTAVVASPTMIAAGGGTSTITPTISDPDVVATVTVSVDGSSGTAQVNLHEGLVFSVDPADIGNRGHVVATVDQGGSLAIGSDGASFVFTAS